MKKGVLKKGPVKGTTKKGVMKKKAPDKYKKISRRDRA